MLDEWLARVGHSKVEPMKNVARAIRDNASAALVHGLSNAGLEAADTKLKLLTRLAFGFHDFLISRAVEV